MQIIKGFVIFSLTIFGPVIFGQTDSVDIDQLLVPKNYTSQSIEQEVVTPIKKFDVGLELGTAFTYSKSNFYGPSFYVAPNISYLISPKFKLSTGGILQKSTFHALYPLSEDQSDILPMTQAFLYAKGSYFLNDKLTISGTVYTEVNDIPKLSRYSSPHNANSYGMSMDLDYKISKSVSFGVHISTNNLNNSPSIYPVGYVPYIGF